MNREFKHLNLNILCSILRFGAYFFLEEEGRVGDPTLCGNTMQAHRRWAQLGACDERSVVRRRRTSKSGNLLSVMKFLFEALAAFGNVTKLRTSPRFLHGLLIEIGSPNRLHLRCFSLDTNEFNNMLCGRRKSRLNGLCLNKKQQIRHPDESVAIS